MKKTKKISRRGEIDHFKTEDHFKKVNEINSPFRSQQITGSPHHTMSKYLPKYANEPNEHYIIISQKSGKKIAVGVGEEHRISSSVINNTLNKANIRRKTDMSKRKDKNWIHLHNHPNNNPVPSFKDNKLFGMMNVNSRNYGDGKPEKFGIISKKSAIILTYPNPLNDDDPISLKDMMENEISSGYQKYKESRDKNKNLNASEIFDHYAQLRGIEKETINFDKPLYMSRKRKTVKPKTKKKRKKST